MMNEDQKKYLNNIRRCSDSENRLFVMTAEALGDMKMYSHFFTAEKKAKLMSDLHMGNLTDAHIMWALSALELATTETIEIFLRAYHRPKDNKQLAIPDGYRYSSRSARSPIEERIRVLYKDAMFFRKVYPKVNADTIPYRTDTDTIGETMYEAAANDPRNAVIYGILPDTTSAVNHLMEKNMPIKPSVHTYSPRMTLAKAACAYVAAKTADSIVAEFEGIREEAFQTRDLGRIELPPVLKFKASEKERYNVCFYPVFLGKQTLYQTENDYSNFMKRKCDEIKNYLYIMLDGETKKADARKTYVVAVCESSADIDTFTALCQAYKTVIRGTNIERIYITSEGAVKEIPDISKAFLRMRLNEEGYVETYPEVPPFAKPRLYIN